MGAMDPPCCGVGPYQTGWVRAPSPTRQGPGGRGFRLPLLLVCAAALGLQGALGDPAFHAPPITYTIPSQRLRGPDGKMEFRMGFGSCSQKRDDQPVWQNLMKENIHAFGWMGDAVYTDFNQFWVLGQKSVRKPAERRKFFQEQLVHRQYSPFWEGSFSLDKELCGRIPIRDCGINSSEPVVMNPAASFFNTNPTAPRAVSQVAYPILGTWDDHDYGEDNAYHTFKTKEESQTMYLDFLGVPKQSPRREQVGVYSSYYFSERAPSGKVGTFAKMIFLDSRYFKKPRLAYGEGADMLGEHQWDWLEAQLTETRGEPYVVIVTSIQFLTQMLDMEAWVDDAPGDRAKLLRMVHRLNQERNRTTLFVSGDIHQSENVGMQCSDLDNAVFYEITTSGMTTGVGLAGFFEPLMSAKYAAPRTHDVKHLNFGIIRLQFDQNTGPDNSFRGGEQQANLDLYLIDQSAGPEVFQTSTTVVKSGPAPSWVKSTECLTARSNIEERDNPPAGEDPEGRSKASPPSGLSKKNETAAVLGGVGVFLLIIAGLIVYVQHKRHPRASTSVGEG